MEKTSKPAMMTDRCRGEGHGDKRCAVASSTYTRGKINALTARKRKTSVGEWRTQVSKDNLTRPNKRRKDTVGEHFSSNRGSRPQIEVVKQGADRLGARATMNYK